MDGLLSYTILEVGIDPTEGELLLLCLTCRTKFVVRKAAVVTMIVLDLHTVLGGKRSKARLASRVSDKV